MCCHAAITAMLDAKLFHVRQPMKFPFGHAAASRRCSDSIVLELTYDIFTGLGECAPRPYVTSETSTDVLQSCKQVDVSLLVRLLETLDARALIDELYGRGIAAIAGLPSGNNVICLFEMAILDIVAHREGLPLRDILAMACHIHKNGSVVGANPAYILVTQVLDLDADIEQFLDQRGPFHFIKLKASNDLRENVRRAEFLRIRLGDDVPLIVDANMAWDVREAADNIKALHEMSVSLYEEPIAKGRYAELCKLRETLGVRIMLDESLCSYKDALIALRYDACDAFNIRVSKCGGLLNSIRLVELARERGIAYQIGVQVAEVGPLIAAERHLAFLCNDHLTVEAGQSDRFFDRLIVAPAPPVDRLTNTISLPSGTGLGVSLTREADAYLEATYRSTTRGWQSVQLPIKGTA